MLRRIYFATRHAWRLLWVAGAVTSLLTNDIGARVLTVVSFAIVMAGAFAYERKQR